MKRFKKFAAVLLAFTALLSACSGGGESWAFRSGNTEVSPGLYILYQIAAFGEAEEKFAATQENYTGMEAKELLRQTVEGKPASDWVNERAAQLAAEHIEVKEKFASLGLSLREDSLAYIENNIGSMVAGANGFYERNGVSESTLREYYMGYERKNVLFLTLYGKGGELEANEDELKKYFADNYSKLDLMLMFKPVSVPEGETKTLEQLVAEVKTEAEGYLTRLKSGEEIEQLAFEWDQKQASEETKADVKKPEKGQLSTVISESDRSGYGEALTDAALKAEAGNAEMVEEDYFFALFRKADIMEDSSVFESYRSSVLNELKGEDYESKLGDWAAALQLETNSAVVNKYKPEKIKYE